MLKINIRDNFSRIPSDTIGIDMGQSLTKIVHLYEKELILKSIPTQSSHVLIKELLDSNKENFVKVNFTGGKCFRLFKKYGTNLEVKLINEFESTLKGIEFLHINEKKKELLASLIVTMGTGTSIILKDKTFKHLGGSALGGGFFMGIVKLLTKIDDFSEVIQLGNKGNRYNIDLKVSDIYDPEDNRVDLLFREFTAASFGKINNNFNLSTLQKKDLITSLICVIGENVGTLATLMAENNNITNIVFCGGFLKENKTLRKILSLLCRVHKKKPIFLKNSEYSAAIGALIL